MEVFAPLKFPLYRRMWLTSLVFSVGHTMHVVAGNWIMLELTGSPLWVGMMVAAPNLPLLFLAVPSGAMADMVDRRLVLVLAGVLMFASAGSMSVLWILGMLTAPWLLSLGILVGIGIAFYVPAWQAVVPNLVPRDMVPSAISLNSAGGAVAMAVGPALGGVLVGLFGPGVPFTAAAVGYLILMAGIATIRNVRWRDDVGASMRIAMAIGLRYLRFSTGYRWLLTVAAAFAISAAALRGMLPNVTSDRLAAGAGSYGFLLAAMGIGALLGALFRQQADGKLGHRLAAWGILAYGVAGIAVGLSARLWVSAIAMVLAGVAWTWVLTTLNSTVQMLAPAWV
ncbi:MAG: MFS transporter, partial [Nitriliruptoraceae bacterium]